MTLRLKDYASIMIQSHHSEPYTQKEKKKEKISK